MKEIVDKILKEEEIARKRIEEAKQKAQEMIEKAQKEAVDMTENAKKQNQERAAKKKEDTQKGYFAEKEKALQEAKEAAIAARETKEKEIPSLTKKIFQRIITIED